MNIKKFKYKIVNSTNDIAIKLIKHKNVKVGIVVAEKQKRGRGQRGKRWISFKGNFFATIFFSIERMNLTLKQLTKINANLVKKIISKFYKDKIKIKLPNDILINKKKICGILQETVQKNSTKYIIIGIGLNLIKSPYIKEYQTTCLYDLTKKKITVNKVLNELKNSYMLFLKSKKFI